MKQTRMYSAATRSKKQKERKMQIFHHEIDREYEPDWFCLFLWDATMPDWISDELRKDMVDALRGFDENMALEIADDLVDCWSGLGLHTTGIKHVDELLGKLYMKIMNCAHSQGVVLANWK